MSEKAKQIIKRYIQLLNPSDRKSVEETLKQFEIIKIRREVIDQKRNEILSSLKIDKDSVIYANMIGIISNPAGIIRGKFISDGEKVQALLNYISVFNKILTLGGLVLMLLFFVKIYFIFIGLICWLLAYFVFNRIQTYINVELAARLFVYDEICLSNEKGTILEIEDNKEGNVTHGAPPKIHTINNAYNKSQYNIKNNSLIILFKGNDRTSCSFMHMCIPIKHLNAAINKTLAFKNELVIIVEIINGGEFLESTKGKESQGYLISQDKEGTYHINIPESNANMFVDLCIRGVVKIIEKQESVKINEETLWLEIKEAFNKELDSIPKYRPDMASQEDNIKPEDRVRHNPDNSGIFGILIHIIIKVKSIKAKYNGGIDQFIKDFNCNLETDNELISTAYMGWEGIDEDIKFLKNNGLQCSVAPVDFYVIDFSSIIGGGPPIHCTLDDNALEISKIECSSNKMLVKLKKAT